MTKTLALFLALATLIGIGCTTQPATCGPCGDNAIVCTDTVQACIEDGGGTCNTGGPGNLQLNADGTFHQEFGAYAQTGTWVESDGALVLTSDG